MTPAMRPLTSEGQRAIDNEPASVGPQQMGPELGEHPMEDHQLEADEHVASIFIVPRFTPALERDARNRRPEHRHVTFDSFWTSVRITRIVLAGADATSKK